MPSLVVGIDTSKFKQGVSDAKRASDSLVSSISKFSSTKALDNIVRQFDEVGIVINRSSNEVQALAARMGKLAQENAFKTLANDAKLSAFQIAKIRMGMGDMRGAISSMGSVLKASSVGALALAASFVGVGKAILDAQIQLERLEQSYTAVFGEAGVLQLQMIYEQTEKVGQQYFEVAEAAKTFFAAGSDTALANELDDIFRAVSNAGAALQLSTEQINGTFVALGQMISKGKVQAEELRGQLGERLPGAFQMAARAMNMTTAELDKFMADGKLTAEDLLPRLAEALEEKYGKAAENAANTAQGSINRMSTAWTLFKSNVMESDGMIAVINAVTDALNSFNSNATTARENSRIDKKLAERGITPAIQSFDYDIAGNRMEYSGYSEQQRDIIRIEERQAAYLEQYEKAEEKQSERNLALGRSRLESAYNSTLQGKIDRKQQELKELQKAAEALFNEQEKQNVDSSDDIRKLQIAEKELKDEIKALEQKNNATSTTNKSRGSYSAQQERTRQDTAAKEQKKQDEIRLNFTRDYNATFQSEYEQQAAALEAQYLLYSQHVTDKNMLDQWYARRQEEISQDAFDGIKRGLRSFGDEYSNVAAMTEQLTTQLGNSISTTLTNAFMTGKFSAQDFFQSIVAMAAQAASNYFIGQIFSGIGNFFTPTTYNGMTSSAASAAASTSGYTGMGMRWSGGSAHGNVFDGISNFSNTIVTSPTLFSHGTHFKQYALGAGLMGEAGPEAVMPLTRTSGGDLGVKVDMSDIGYQAISPRVTVNLNNQTGTPMEAEAQAMPDGQGGFTLDVILVQLEQGLTARARSGRSTLTGYMEKAYGLSRAGIMSRNRR